MWFWRRSWCLSCPARLAASSPRASTDHPGVHSVSDRSRLRLVVLRVLVVSLLATLLGRLWYLQVLAGPQYERAAADNQIRDVVATAPRGDILDDRGRPWARNETAMVVSVDRLALLRQS